ncbi:MAG: glycoside hydrolase family 2 TIM barrel-domain containing protein [Verrucomicrobiota bacterium]
MKTITCALILGLFGISLAAQEWKPVPGHIMTQWAADVNPRNPLPEYPRPQMARKDWVNLNGLWEYAIQPLDAPSPAKFAGKILVPFPIESALSGVKKPLTREERLWYRRTFKSPKLTGGKRLLLHFGAVDWEAKAFVNGKAVGEHRGGYDSFTFDITEALKPGAENELVVAVFDATGAGQATGKQNFKKIANPGRISYTPSSGIWQTVWLETVAATHIQQLKLIPDVDAVCLRVTVAADGVTPETTVEIIALDGRKETARIKGKPGVELKLPIPNVRLWTPDDPFLYSLRVRVGHDEVTSYFGMRKIALGKDENGFTTMLLNGKAVFEAGPLDQGFWPDGIYTAPTDEALRWDIAEMKRLGFNMVRKHIKVEPARWFYWCDKLGLLVWQDMPSGGVGRGGNREKEGVMGEPAVARQFEAELRAMIEQHWNHPSIIMWDIFNEAWGQYDTARLTREVKQLDPSRLVDSASGWADTRNGDVHDRHNYPRPACPEPEAARAAVLGEFGGIGLSIPDHTWTGSTWGYSSVSGERALTRKYLELWREVWQLKTNKGLRAAVYTQWTDIETEGNGLYTYDRKILKVNANEIADANRGVFTAPKTFDVVVPTAQTEALSWRYTTAQPSGDWIKSAFDDATWRAGAAGFGAAGFTNAPVRTPWESDELWLRREVVLPQGELHFPALRVMHNQPVEIFINGVLAVSVNSGRPNYEDMDINPEAVKAIKPGVNQLAVHTRRGKRVPFIDVGLVQERRQ